MNKLHKLHLIETTLLVIIPMFLCWEEVTVHSGHQVLMEFDNNGAMIVGDPKEILVQQLRHHKKHLSNIIFILMLIIY
jgi:hypothetical protein